MSTATKSEIVSSETEPLILVDSNDRILGSLDKSACHDGAGVLHRAFSLFVLNSDGEVLLQRRQSDKRLWPGYWSNSCCSHPRRGESIADAVHRRAWDELGLAVTELDFLYKFEYRASYTASHMASYIEVGSEHELCSVFLGRSVDVPRINTTEIADWRWVAPADLDAELRTDAPAFTPWLKLEWRRLRGEFSDRF